MKIPTLLMASLLSVGIAAQTTKPSQKSKKKVVKKVHKVNSQSTKAPAKVVKKDTISRHSGYSCPACGMG